jgi:acyl-CoA dehydrogenase
MGYQAPIAEIAFTMNGIAGLDTVIATGAFGDLSAETVEAILAEAGRFAAEELAPLNPIGDRSGARLEGGRVTTPAGWKEAYARWAAAGWNGISAPAEWGGQALPVMVQAAAQELWNFGAAAFATGPMLTAGAIEALVAHGSTALQERYLPKLVSGEWMATMNLTEPQAGSDLGGLKTHAERAVDGSYRIFGQKIFITYGEHDFTPNIIHLVLARLPDAPAGTAGISLFLVPKMLVADDGSIETANDVVCAGIETKLGLHGSPTCVMVYGGTGGGAVGFLVGEEHRGLAAMFTMMNLARLNVGIQGIGVGERAYQQALAYANERRQGRAQGVKGNAMSPIIAHPDVRRMLLEMKALVAASRAIAYACAQAIDMSRHAAQAERGRWAERAGLLTPIAKAFSTDAGIEVASLGIQVHGGTGYIEQTGAAQHLRDARIFTIYEGTNGIQAIDLVMRKLRLADGAAVRTLIEEFAAIAAEAEATNRPEFGRMGARLHAAVDNLSRTTDFLLSALREGRQTDALAGATPYLRLFGLATGGALLAKGALRAGAESDRNRWVALARFFAETMIEETAALAAIVTEGAEALHQASALLFGDPAKDKEQGLSG